MRKVFFSIMFGQDLKENVYVSDDFDLHDKQFLFPLTYLVENNIKTGDEVVILTAVEKGGEKIHRSFDNYELFKKEIMDVASEKNVTVKFLEIWIEDAFSPKYGREFFKEVVSNIKDNDLIYADMTFGIKIFSISSFIALAYVARANLNVEVKDVIYAWKYSSTVDALQAKKSKIYDVTSLFYLNQIAGRMNEGERTVMDKMLKF